MCLDPTKGENGESLLPKMIFPLVRITTPSSSHGIGHWRMSSWEFAREIVQLFSFVWFALKINFWFSHHFSPPATIISHRIIYSIRFVVTFLEIFYACYSFLLLLVTYYKEIRKEYVENFLFIPFFWKDLKIYVYYFSLSFTFDLRINVTSHTFAPAIFLILIFY